MNRPYSFGGISFIGIGTVIIGIIVQFCRFWSVKNSCSATNLSCEASIRERTSTSLSSKEWGRVVEEGEGIAADIQRRSNFTPAEWLSDFYPYGRPVIVTDATKGWDIFEFLSDDWIVSNWANQDSRATVSIQSEVGTFEKKKKENLNPQSNPHLLGKQFEKEKEQAALHKYAHGVRKQSRTWGDDYSFADIYLFLTDSPSHPFSGMYKSPYFLPDEGRRMNAYYGGEILI